MHFVVMICCLLWLNCDCFRIKIMYNHFNDRSGMKAPLIADDVYEIITKVLLLIEFSVSGCVIWVFTCVLWISSLL